jgi:hypothetical protein
MCSVATHAVLARVPPRPRRAIVGASPGPPGSESGTDGAEMRFGPTELEQALARYLPTQKLAKVCSDHGVRCVPQGFVAWCLRVRAC